MVYDPKPKPPLPDIINSGTLPRPELPPSFAGDWLREGTFNIVYSRAGLGKTGFIVEMIKAMMSREETFLGMKIKPVNGMKCLWVNGELPLPLFNYQVRDVLPLDFAYLDATGFNLMDYTHELISSVQAMDIVVFDTRSSLFQISDPNDPTGWVLFNDFMGACRATGTVVILATHAGKVSNHANSQSTFGSSAQEWFADNIISLQRPNKTDFKKDPWKDWGQEYHGCFEISHEKAKWSSPFKTIHAQWMSDYRDGPVSKGRYLAFNEA